jgi:hypothetical protein
MLPWWGFNIRFLVVCLNIVEFKLCAFDAYSSGLQPGVRENILRDL